MVESGEWLSLVSIDNQKTSTVLILFVCEGKRSTHQPDEREKQCLIHPGSFGGSIASPFFLPSLKVKPEFIDFGGPSHF